MYLEKLSNLFFFFFYPFLSLLLEVPCGKKDYFPECGQHVGLSSEISDKYFFKRRKIFLSKNEISCSQVVGLCMIMKEQQQECVDFHNGHTGFGKILCLPSLTLPAEMHQHFWGFSPSEGPISALSYLTGRSVHFEGNLDLPLASFPFTSKLSLLSVPFLSTFCVLLSLVLSPYSHLFGCPSSFVTVSAFPPYFVHVIPLCRILEEAFESKQHWSHFLVTRPPFIAYDMISYISAHNHRINI